MTGAERITKARLTHLVLRPTLQCMGATKDAADPAAAAARAVRQYPIGTVHSVCRIGAGLIHQTFLVETSTAKFVLQKLHRDMASDANLADYRAVTEHLGRHAFPSPRLVLSREGAPAVDLEGSRFRLITHLEGVSCEFVTHTRMAEEAAKMLGAFHQATAELRYAFTAGRPLHDSPKHFEAFRAAFDLNSPPKGGGDFPEEAAPLVEKVRTHMPRHFLPEPLPSRVVHGDPKISNILFDPKNGDATGLVDLDSCARHTALVDLGDAVRSWCREGPEDGDPPTPFLPDRFRAVCEGYRGSGSSWSAVEKKLVGQSCRLITLELASRFLRDVVEDRYFGWDPARFGTRPAHNLARARGCVALYESMASQEDVMEKIVREVWP